MITDGLTKQQAENMIYAISQELYRPYNKNRFKIFINGDIYTKRLLSDMIQDLMDDYGMTINPYFADLHHEIIGSGKPEISKQEYQKHYLRDWRRFKHGSMEAWGIRPKKRGRPPGSKTNPLNVMMRKKKQLEKVRSIIAAFEG